MKSSLFSAEDPMQDQAPMPRETLFVRQATGRPCPHFKSGVAHLKSAWLACASPWIPSPPSPATPKNSAGILRDSVLLLGVRMQHSTRE